MSTHAQAIVACAAPTLASGFQIAIGVDATLETGQARPGAAVAGACRLLSTDSTVAEAFEALLGHIALRAVGAALAFRDARGVVEAGPGPGRATEVQTARASIADAAAAPLDHAAL
jgi:hypothetical protein